MGNDTILKQQSVPVCQCTLVVHASSTACSVIIGLGTRVPLASKQWLCSAKTTVITQHDTSFLHFSNLSNITVSSSPSWCNAAVMRPLGILANVIAGLSLSVYGASDDLVGDDRIKVFLFAKPAFWSEVAVDAYNNVCIDLDNNLFVSSFQIAGKVGILTP
jgi:hypothetical protein